MRTALALVLAAFLSAGFALAGCTGTSARGKRTLTVFAAASLTDVLQAAGSAFGREHPDVDVRFDFGASNTLALQLTEGASAGVFASADPQSMQKVVAAGLVGGIPATLTRNELTIVVPPGNPGAVRGLADLARLRLVALCASPVPCGRLADTALAGAGVRVPEDHVTRQPDVRSTLGAVEFGDAEAGIVYVTDAHSAGSHVDTIPIPPGQNLTTAYPIAALKPAHGTPSADARAFVAFVQTPPIRALFGAAGFLSP